MNRYDEKLAEVIRYVSGFETVTAAGIQKRFLWGYMRAERVLEQMEELGIISERQGFLPFAVLVGKEQAEDIIAKNRLNRNESR